MSFFASLGRFIKTCFGLAEGKTQRAADDLVTSTPDAIRNQFRKVKEDRTKDFHQLLDAVGEIEALCEDKRNELKDLKLQEQACSESMAGSIELYKRMPDERFRAAYADAAAQGEGINAKALALVDQIKEQTNLIAGYRQKLKDLRDEINALDREESETVADLVSNRKISEINARLEGLSVDTQSKNLEAVREARHKAMAKAKISSGLLSNPGTEFHKSLASIGKGMKHLESFDEAVKLDAVFAKPDEPLSLTEKPTEKKSLDSLFGVTMKDV